jgi:hypothetical protein
MNIVGSPVPVLTRDTAASPDAADNPLAWPCSVVLKYPEPRTQRHTFTTRSDNPDALTFPVLLKKTRTMNDVRAVLD